MAELPPKQGEVLRYLANYIARETWAPSMREMCIAFGWASSHTAHCHLNALKRKGLIERVKGQARAIRLTQAGRRAL